MDNQPMKIGRAQSRLGGRVGLTSNTQHVVVEMPQALKDTSVEFEWWDELDPSLVCGLKAHQKLFPTHPAPC